MSSTAEPLACPGCGREDDTGASFCPSCGMPLVRAWRIDDGRVDEQPVEIE